MSSANKVFEETYRQYLDQLAGLDLVEVARRLGLEMQGEEVLLTLLGDSYRASADGLFDERGERAGFSECIVLFKYLLMAPERQEYESEWAAYHSFKDAQPLLDYFAREVTAPLERAFAGKLPLLERAGAALGGVVSSEEGAFDFSMEFTLLQTVPLLLRFNDVDEEFPAQATILFRKSIESYLDMESVGVLGALYTRKLIANAFGTD